MTKPKRIQRKRARGWRMPAGAVYVGRPTKWGNPFQVGDLSDRGMLLKTPSMVVEAYRRYLVANPDLARQVQRDLRGRDLACWCAPDAPCHADVLLEVANL